jgi:hypothetical protein
VSPGAEPVYRDRDAGQLESMEVLRDSLLERYRSKRGLVFAVNPISNRQLGAIGNLKAHPIFRWDPPDGTLLESKPP